MKTRIINIIASLALLFLIMGCSEMDSLMGERSENRISLTMQMPTDEKTRVSLSEASDTKDLIARWQEDDEVQVFFRQDNNIYEAGKIKLSGISQDGKKATLNMDLPGMLNQTKPFTIYCFTGIEGRVRDVDNGVWYPYCRMDVIRSLKTKFKAPMFAQIDVPSAFNDGDFNGGAGGSGSSWGNGGSSQDGAGGGGTESWGSADFVAHFKHIGTYEVLHLKNTSTNKVSVVHCGFETKLPWYQDYAGVDLVDSYDFTKLPSEWDGDNESPALEIPAGTEGVFLSSYMPSGFKVEDAQLVTRIDGVVVKSSNKKSSNVTIQRRHAYHMYASWDGNELKFEDGEITLREGKHIMVYPSSINFGEVAVGLSKTEQFTVRNVGTESVGVKVSEKHGEIDIYDSGKAFTLPSGEEKVFVVSYRPTSANAGFNSRVSVETNAEEGEQFVDFHGSAIAPNYDSVELIYNGDFSLGAVGFTSDYGYVSETGSRALWDEGKYSVGTNPSYYHTGWINRGDHSTGTGNMLIVNGNIDNSKYVWKQSVYVEKGKTYEFSAWFIDVSNGIDKNAIEYNIGGTSNMGEYDKTENGWDRYYWRYTATETGPIVLKIRTMSAAAGGNDFAIDDISFTSKLSDQDVQTETITIPGTNVSFKMVVVEGGTFWMGSADDDEEAWDAEKPRHQVKLSSFSIGETEVTQALWEAVMGSNPSYFKGANRPVEKVLWEDCQEFITKLNTLTGRSFRLPTEAEWEYSARGGKNSQGYKYAGSNDIDAVAWYCNNIPSQNEGDAGYGTQSVATKQPNELGLYDMSGNVWEWCQDYHSFSYYSNSPSVNPCNTTKDPDHVRRGGCWWGVASYCRVPYRTIHWYGYKESGLGFRLAMSEAWSHPSDGGHNGPFGGDDGL